jgi:hypothetical protein
MNDHPMIAPKSKLVPKIWLQKYLHFRGEVTPVQGVLVQKLRSKTHDTALHLTKHGLHSSML